MEHRNYLIVFFYYFLTIEQICMQDFDLISEHYNIYILNISTFNSRQFYFNLLILPAGYIGGT